MAYATVIGAIDDYARQESGVGVMLADIKNFATINAGLGFAFGDQIIERVLVVLNSLSFGLYSASHYHSDKYLILFPNLTSQDKLGQYATMLVNYFGNNPIVVNDLEVPVGLKISFSSIKSNPNPSSASTLSELELTLREIKSENLSTKFAVTTVEDVSTWFYGAMSYTSFRNAVARREFVNYYQPIVEVNTGDVIAFESLIRWHNPELGVLAPAHFLPQIEKHGLLSRITLTVLKNAIDDFSQLLASLEPNVYISVNVPPTVLLNKVAREKIFSLINKSKFPPSRLAFELTEHNFSGSFESVVEACHEVRGVGIKILIDDFGTGYSTVERVRSLPINGIKVDKQFLLDRQSASVNQSLLKFAAELGRVTETLVICEGIADQESLKLVHELGIKGGQGFLFSRPVPLSELFTSNCRETVELYLAAES